MEKLDIKKILFILSVLMLIVALGFALMIKEIRGLESKVEFLQSEMDGSVEDEQYSELYNEMEELRKMLSDSSSFIGEVKVKHGELDTDTMKGPVSIYFEPKEFDSNGSASVRINDSEEKIAMERTSHGYKCVADLSFKKEIDTLSFAFESGGVIRTQKVCYDDDIMQIDDSSFKAELAERWYFGNRNITLEGDTKSETNIKVFFANGEFSDKAPCLYKEQDGKVIYKKELKKKYSEEDGYYYAISKDEINSGSSGECAMYLEYTFKDGIKARQNFTVQKKDGSYDYSDLLTYEDKNGKVFYKYNNRVDECYSSQGSQNSILKYRVT